MGERWLPLPFEGVSEGPALGGKAVGVVGEESCYDAPMLFRQARINDGLHKECAESGRVGGYGLQGRLLEVCQCIVEGQVCLLDTVIGRRNLQGTVEERDPLPEVVLQATADFCGGDRRRGFHGRYSIRIEMSVGEG